MYGSSNFILYIYLFHIFIYEREISSVPIMSSLKMLECNNKAAMDIILKDF